MCILGTLKFKLQLILLETSHFCFGSYILSHIVLVLAFIPISYDAYLHLNLFESMY